MQSEMSIRTSKEYQAILEKQRLSRLKKAGLTGDYATAQCKQGEYLFELVKLGTGAYLWGDVGTGKTYSAASAVRLALKAGLTAKLTTSKRLLDAIKKGYDEHDSYALESAETVQLLVLDDLGAERPTDWAIETLSGLIDARYATNHPTIITSNFRLGELRDTWGGIPGARVASRIAGACKTIHFTGDDRRLIHARHTA